MIITPIIVKSHHQFQLTLTNMMDGMEVRASIDWQAKFQDHIPKHTIGEYYFVRVLRREEDFYKWKYSKNEDMGEKGILYVGGENIENVTIEPMILQPNRRLKIKFMEHGTFDIEPDGALSVYDQVSGENFGVYYIVKVLRNMKQYLPDLI